MCKNSCPRYSIFLLFASLFFPKIFCDFQSTGDCAPVASEITAGSGNNDHFSARIPITGPVATVTSSNVSAGKQPGEPDHAGDSGGKSVWWTWTAPTNGTVVINTLGSSFDTVLAVYTGNILSELFRIASDDQSGGSNLSKLTFEGTAGTAYQIAVDGWNGASGVVVMNLQIFFGPPEIISFSHVSDPSPALIGSRVDLEIVATGTQPISYEWRKNGSTLSNVMESIYTIYPFDANDAGTFSVAVSNRFGSAITTNLAILVPPPPQNDDFSDRIFITGVSNVLVGNNANATFEATESPPF